MEQPPGTADPQYPSHVCKLRKALYGLKQAPRAWFDRFSIFLLQYGFFGSLANPSLFIFHSNSDTLILLLYIDDILTGSSAPLVTNLIQLLSSEFAMKDLGPIHHFLGIEITQTPEGLHLSQSHYALTILERAGMVDCKPMSTSLEAKTKTTTNDILLQDPHVFRGLVGALQYLTLTRPDISYSVNFISQFMHAPTIIHFKMVHRILRYIKGTIDTGLNFTSHSTLDLCASPMQIGQVALQQDAPQPDTAHSLAAISFHGVAGARAPQRRLETAGATFCASCVRCCVLEIILDLIIKL